MIIPPQQRSCCRWLGTGRLGVHFTFPCTANRLWPCMSAFSAFAADPDNPLYSNGLCFLDLLPDGVTDAAGVSPSSISNVHAKLNLQHEVDQEAFYSDSHTPRTVADPSPNCVKSIPVQGANTGHLASLPESSARCRGKQRPPRMKRACERCHLNKRKVRRQRL